MFDVQPTDPYTAEPQAADDTTQQVSSKNPQGRITQNGWRRAKLSLRKQNKPAKHKKGFG